MLKADAMILGSPTYFAAVSADLKALIERAGFVAYANGHAFSGKIGARSTGRMRSAWWLFHTLHLRRTYFSRLRRHGGQRSLGISLISQCIWTTSSPMQSGWSRERTRWPPCRHCTPPIRHLSRWWHFVCGAEKCGPLFSYRRALSSLQSISAITT